MEYLQESSGELYALDSFSDFLSGLLEQTFDFVFPVVPNQRGLVVNLPRPEVVQHSAGPLKEFLPQSRKAHCQTVFVENESGLWLPSDLPDLQECPLVSLLP